MPVEKISLRISDPSTQSIVQDQVPEKPEIEEQKEPESPTEQEIVLETPVRGLTHSIEEKEASSSIPFEKAPA